MSRPLIGVTGPDGWFVPAWWFSRWAIFLAGGRAVRLTPSRPKEEWQQRLDGILIGGGDDIDPGLYSFDEEEAEHAPINAARDVFEQELIRFALNIGLPLMGICRGAQLINVVLGGTLHRDISKQRKKTSNRRTPFPTKSAFIESDSELAMWLGHVRVRINSLHHQAVKKPGKGLRIVARDADDFVQAIEGGASRFLLGVQWHPEYLPLHRSQRRLFKALVTAAQRN